MFAFDERAELLTPSRFDANRRFSLPGMRPEAHEGVALEPYLSGRGAQVVGAWRWLDDLGLGIAIEIEATEAYAPLRFLRTAFGAVFGALVIAVAAALYSALSVLRLRGELGGQRKLGAYRLGRMIGEGGLANVYLARHDLLKRPCAVKLLKPARASDEMIARFEREVQFASQLSHPNVVEIYDYGRSTDGLFYYAMEYLDGINLGELVAREGAIAVPRSIRILQQVRAGLGAAHAAGLVHRDIKPENVMISRRGEEPETVKILDFGMVKKVDTEHSRDLTRGLRIFGTPLYMAPERLRNPADVDARTDIYALGAVAFFMLSGRKIYESSDDLELTSRILNEVPPRVSQVAPQPIPVELDLLVQACLEKRREDRPQRIGDLIEALVALAAQYRAPGPVARGRRALVPGSDHLDVLAADIEKGRGDDLAAAQLQFPDFGIRDGDELLRLGHVVRHPRTGDQVDVALDAVRTGEYRHSGAGRVWLHRTLRGQDDWNSGHAQSIANRRPAAAPPSPQGIRRCPRAPGWRRTRDRP